jgi:hypothetical protein
MKTKQFFAAALLIGSLTFGTVSASENTSAPITMKSLTEQIKETFSETPYELVNDPSDMIVVEFKIDKEHKFDLVKVVGKNEELANYSRILLESKTITVDPSVEPRTYHVPMRFVSK